jgi:uncharacterized protein YoaH (UPF0181 family)
LGAEGQPNRDIEGEREKGEEKSGEVGGEEPETGTALKDPAYQKQIEREKEIQDKLDADKDKNTNAGEKKDLEAEDKDKVKKQILMTADEAKVSQIGVGLGTPESRTGESVTVYAGQKIKELLSKGISYEDARAQVEAELMEIANNKNYVLTKDWVKSGLSVFDYLNDNIGIDNIEHFAWDTPEGNELVGSTNHGTSSDMFIKTKDGELIGISLKKDFKVFIVNGGYNKAIKEFESMLGISLPDECQSEYYNNKRSSEYENGKSDIISNRKDYEEVAERFLNDEEYFNKIFGPKSAAYQSRKRYIEKKLGISDWKEATPSQLVDLLINGSTNEDLKFFAAFNKDTGLREKYGVYNRLRDLDEMMADNIFNFFIENSEAKSKYKEKIIEDTHILDTLFPSKPLNGFKTLFGTDPAVEMTKNAISNIFGVSELMKNYEEATDEAEKDSIKAQISNEIKNKLVITKKKGIPVIAVNIDGPPQSELPLYKLGVRTRGIGNAQTLEVSKETFGALALKNGSIDVINWEEKDRKIVVDAEASDIISTFEDDDFDFDTISSEEKSYYQEKIKLLKSWDPTSKKVEALLQYVK